jgi:hypothetical protein
MTVGRAGSASRLTVAPLNFRREAASVSVQHRQLHDGDTYASRILSKATNTSKYPGSVKRMREQHRPAPICLEDDNGSFSYGSTAYFLRPHRAAICKRELERHRSARTLRRVEA